MNRRQPATGLVWQRKLAEFGRGKTIFAAASLVLLIPCFWQSRIQAGDLSSHIYNAWLAQLIRQIRAPGLFLAHQTTNLLFDWMLSAFLPLGRSAAERIAVSIAVLTFVWGAFAFVSVVSGRRAWHMLAPVAMLAYGWVFRMGFFNFYVSLGLCFGAMALLWRGGPRRTIAAIPLFAIAWLAHALPVIWAFAVLAYVYTARRVPAERRLILVATAIVGIVAARTALASAWDTRWFAAQALEATGLHQVRVFDDKYRLAMLGLFLIWVVAAFELASKQGVWSILRGIPFHLSLLTAAGIAVIPTVITIPGYEHALVYISERMGLALCICICATVAAAPAHALRYCLNAAVTVLFFAFLWHDERALNVFENRMTAAVGQLPPGQRVLNGVNARGLHVNAMVHMIDRVCVGRCYSYGNYEPSTAQFRVRVLDESPLVVSANADSMKIEVGTYIVQPRDLPLYQVVADDTGQLSIRSLTAGEATGISIWNPL